MPIETVPDSSLAKPAPRPVWDSILRGLRKKCPACGKGNIYRRYLKVVDTCPDCGEELHHHRADDAPPYFTMIITGHVVVAGVMWMEQVYAPDFWVQIAIWFPVLILMSLWLLPRVKGGLVGLQWALRMHGFSGAGEDTPEQP
jgi:uncharacterized protein (DUF983 family)